MLVSAFYRFALAGALFLPILALFGRVQATGWRDHGFFLLQGCCLFSFNFVCFYTASQYVVSGLISVVFSAATLFNALNSRLLWGERPRCPVSTRPQRWVSPAGDAVLGSIASGSFDGDAALGAGLSVLGTYFFSSAIWCRCATPAGHPPLDQQRLRDDLRCAGATRLCRRHRRRVETGDRPGLSGSLVYLAIPGSILGFTAYLSLVGPYRRQSRRLRHGTVSDRGTGLLGLVRGLSLDGAEF
ncbi:EamA family transporter [Microbulbifer halophilus]|uniref:EamA family transporter n=1 Tax=Microbulbifer halophilus TaxID=453963 RepID=UPI003605B7F2